jgi:phospholipid/cholesterol/gamma-HCH transport system ATP-binding protein
MKIRLAGLEVEAANKKPGDLSGGMRKRAALARALALDPDLLFLDEPTAGLDPISASRFDELINSLKHTMKLTIFLVTHDLDTLIATCDRVAVLNNGKVLAIGPMDEVRANPDPWIQEYFSGPRGRAAVK